MRNIFHSTNLFLVFIVIVGCVQSQEDVVGAAAEDDDKGEKNKE